MRVRRHRRSVLPVLLVAQVTCGVGVPVAARTPAGDAVGGCRCAAMGGPSADCRCAAGCCASKAALLPTRTSCCTTKSAKKSCCDTDSPAKPVGWDALGCKGKGPAGLVVPEPGLVTTPDEPLRGSACVGALPLTSDTATGRPVPPLLRPPRA